MVVCSDSPSAISHLKRARPRAALLDFNLGNGETSLEVANRLIGLGCPFAFLTGYTPATVLFPAEMGGVERLPKPYADDVPVRTVRNLLKDELAEEADYTA